VFPTPRNARSPPVPQFSGLLLPYLALSACRRLSRDHLISNPIGERTTIRIIATAATIDCSAETNDSNVLFIFMLLCRLCAMRNGGFLVALVLRAHAACDQRRRPYPSMD
jgi:hypothetical protein